MNIDSVKKRRELISHYYSIRSRIISIDRIRVGYEKKTVEGDPY